MYQKSRDLAAYATLGAGAQLEMAGMGDADAVLRKVDPMIEDRRSELALAA